MFKVIVIIKKANDEDKVIKQEFEELEDAIAFGSIYKSNLGKHCKVIVKN